MKLLFDQNLSFKLCALLSDLFPDSKPVRDLDLDRSDDRIVWQQAKDNGFFARLTGFGFCGHGCPLWSSAQSNLATMRKSASSQRWLGFFGQVGK